MLREYPDSDPRFHDGGWFQGHVKLIVCTDQHSVNLYMLAISRIGEAWPGAKLEVVNVENIPQRPRARTLVPAKVTEALIPITGVSIRSKRRMMKSAGSS